MSTESFPKTIFKYQSLSFQSIMNLKRHVIYFGSPATFNDPFDCAVSPEYKPPTEVELNAICARMMSKPGFPPKMQDELMKMSPGEWREAVMRFSAGAVADSCDEFNRHRGVTCFSECNDNMLMWSHYGGQHKGFCVEFRTQFEPFSKLKKVRYREEMPQLEMAPMMMSDEYADLVEDLFCTKSIDWSYEREWRVMHKTAGTEFTYPDQALAAVYLGAKMSSQEIDLIGLILSGQDSGVKLYKGRKSEKHFRIEFDDLGEYISRVEARKRGGSGPAES